MYNFDKIVNRRNTDCVKWNNEIPEDVLPMFIADMDFEVLPEIVDALQKRVDQHIFGYTVLTPAYKNAVVSWMKTRHNWEIQPEWIVPIFGVVPALNASVQAYTQVGDAVLITPPVYGPFSRSVENNGRRLVKSSLINNNGHYTIDFKDFEEKIVNENVKMFILCSPHNPVGRVWTKDELTKIIDICVKHEVMIISDEIHQDFVYKPNKHVPTASINKDASKYIVTCTAPSKTFNLAGLQTSNIIIEDQEKREQFEAILDNLGVHGVNMMGASTCEAAYTHGALWVDEMTDYLSDTMNYAYDYVTKNIPNVTMTKPEGLYLAWFDFSKLGMTNEEVEEFLQNKVKVKPNAGTFFGQEGECFARINFGCPRSYVEEFLRRLEKAVKEL